MTLNLLKIPANYYQQFDADNALDVPAEGYGGWKRADVEICPEHTAVVVMHAWDTGAPGQYPGWERCIEYFPRASAILENVFPPLLAAVREANFNLFHVVGCGDYYKGWPGYQRSVELAGLPAPAPERVPPDAVFEALQQFRAENVYRGQHNEADTAAGFRNLDFAPQARPLPGEDIAENGTQLAALCRERGVNHLIYAGFAINWCLLLLPGGMADMCQYGIICSVFPQAVTAVENKETARDELGKRMALWRVALAYGFVFDVPDFIAAISPR